MQPLVLIVAEDAQTQHALISTLAVYGVRAIRVGLGRPAVTHALGHGPDLVLFNWNRPGIDGVALTAELRASTRAPILVTLAQADEVARGAILDAGASDYVLASLGSSEQLSRIRLWLRQVRRPNASMLGPERGRGRLRFDRERRVLLVEGSEIHITPMESRLVTALMESPARGLSERLIVERLWGTGRATQAQYLRTLVRHLRQKIERDPSRPAHLVGTPGAGFRLKLG